ADFAALALARTVPAVTARADRRQRAVGAGAARSAGPALAIAGPPVAVGRGDAVGGPAQAHPPATLADLQLAETGRAELRDERRQQLFAQSIDRRVIGGPFLGRSLDGSVARLGGFGHGLHLLASGRIVTVERRDRGPDGSAARVEQVAQTVPEPAAGRRLDARHLALSVGPQRPVAPVALLEEHLDGERVERRKPVH